MILHPAPQGSPEWLAARLGIPTASHFGEILTASGKLSQSADRYMNQLLAEWLAGKPVDMDTTVWMERGNELEAEARLSYEIETGSDVAQVGLVYLDEKRDVGCSPDGLIIQKPYGLYAAESGEGLIDVVMRGYHNGIEIKCPKASTLVSYYGKGCPAKYYPQIQGQIWICDLEWVDFYAYHPDLPPYRFRVERDEVYIRSLAEAVAKFNIQLNLRREELRCYTQ